MCSFMKTAGRLLLGIALAGAAACSAGTGDTTGPGDGTPPDSPDAPGPSVVGTYTLTLANGGPLPALLWYDNAAEGMDAEMYVLSGSIVLRSDGTYRATKVSNLIIEGVGEQVSTSITDGTYAFISSPGTDQGEGVIRLTGEAGGQIDLLFSPLDNTLLQHAMIPGGVGQPDMEVTFFYRR
jgi:hypothetical protein